MTNTLLAQLDYIYFFYGLVFFLLGAVCVSISRTTSLATPWWLLGAFAFTHGLAEWLHLVALIGGDSTAFRLARDLLLGASFLLLLEFARRTHRVLHGRTPGRWLHLLPSGAVLALGLAHGPGYVISAVRPLIAAPAIFWTAWLFLFAARHTEESGGGLDAQRARILASIYFTLFGVTAGLVVPSAPFIPVHWPSGEALLAQTGIPIELLRGATVCMMALSVWALAASFDRSVTIVGKKRLQFWAMAAALTGLLAGGWLFTDRLGTLHEKDVIDEAEASASKIYGHLTDKMSKANGGARTMAELLSHFHVAGAAIDLSRLDEVVDSMALASEDWVVYVIDPTGRVISSSNRGRPDSFLRKNFASRSYIKDSLHGRSGRFLGVGIVSNIPGFYASEPVRSADGQVVAVAVVKSNLGKAQLGPGGVDVAYLVTAEGRVILSNAEGQENRPLWSKKVVGASFGPTSANQEREALPALLDQVLVGVTRLVEVNVRDSDTVGRLGGEEFVVLAPSTPATGAVTLAEKLRSLMAATALGPAGRMTGSFGVAELLPSDTAETLLHRADEALYRAKSGGRNRVECGEVSVADVLAASAPEAAPVRPMLDGSSIYAATGYQPIDVEHRALSEAINSFAEMIPTGRSEEVEVAFESILASTGAHFRHEERLMNAHRHPDRVRHAGEHARFTSEALRLLAELGQSGVTVSFRRWSVGRLPEWFRLHIVEHDLQFGQFLLQAAAQDAAAIPELVQVRTPARPLHAPAGRG